MISTHCTSSGYTTPPPWIFVKMSRISSNTGCIGSPSTNLMSRSRRASSAMPVACVDNSSSNNIGSSRDNSSSSNIGRSRSNNNSTSTNRQLFINTDSRSTSESRSTRHPQKF
ncbi:unnamed protein product [Closterium sp. NIES-54]